MSFSFPTIEHWEITGYIFLLSLGVFALQLWELVAMRLYSQRGEEGFIYPESEIDDRIKDIERENQNLQSIVNRETDRYDALLGALRIQPDAKEGTLEEWAKWGDVVEAIVTDKEGRSFE